MPFALVECRLGVPNVLSFACRFLYQMLVVSDFPSGLASRNAKGTTKPSGQFQPVFAFFNRSYPIVEYIEWDGRGLLLG